MRIVEPQFPHDQSVVLQTIPLSTMITSPDFIDDDTISMLATFHPPGDLEAHQYRIYRRRFPEWWWGHFYRPEVWTSITLCVALLVRALRFRRRRVVES